MTPIETFHSSFSPTIGEQPQSLKTARLRAWERFLEKKLPGSVREQFKDIRFQMGLKKEVQLESALVFVNGWFCPELSVLPKGCQVMTLSQAAKTFSGLMQASFTKILKEEQEAFSLLNAAMYQEGAFVYIPPKSKLSDPLQIVSCIDLPEESSWVMPRLHLFVGASSEVTIAQRTLCLNGDKVLYNAAVDISIEENAHVHYILDDLGVSKGVFKGVSKKGWFFDSFRICLKSHATFRGCQLTDAPYTFCDWKVQLVGPGAEADLSGVWLLNKEKQATTNVVIDHQAPHCRSMQLFKGVLSEKARSYFQGKIHVASTAIKTEAYQLNNNLMLSDEAVSESRPNLEIFADDVKASHGATVGQLDSEQLFYLKTRGVSIPVARRLLIAGFCQKVVDTITLPSQRARFHEHLAEYLIHE